MIAAYKALYQFNVDKTNSQYKGPFNTIWNDAKTSTPKDTAIVTPNADTPYSMVQADLRAEPIVLCVPEIEKGRYYSVQLTDMYSFNYGYIGSRATGNGAGCYMVAGPDWKGETPAGIAKAFRSETQFGLIIYRTQLFNPKDIENVKKIQAGYKVQPLSAFLKQPAPPAAPAVNWPAFTEDAFKTEFPAFLDFLLQFCPTVPEEKDLRARFAEIGIGPDKKFDFKTLDDAHKAEVGLGIKDGFEKIQKAKDGIGKDINGWAVGAAFGDRGFYKGDFLLRAAAALAGIYGNDAVEAMYPMAKTASNGEALDGSKANYTLTFPAGELPAGQRVLVRDDVRRQDTAADREPDQPISHQLAHAARDEEERRRLAHALHPERLSRQGEGIQLAAGAERPDLHGHAPVLAQGRAALDSSARRRNLEAAGRAEGELKARWQPPPEAKHEHASEDLQTLAPARIRRGAPGGNGGCRRHGAGAAACGFRLRPGAVDRQSGQARQRPVEQPAEGPAAAGSDRDRGPGASGSVGNQAAPRSPPAHRGQSDSNAQALPVGAAGPDVLSRRPGRAR